MLEWPYEALPAVEIDWHVEGLWVGGITSDNTTSRTETSNGGRWMATATIPLSQKRRVGQNYVKQINLVRALLGQLKRNIPIVMRTCECSFAPRLPYTMGETTYSDGVTHSDGTPFAGGLGLSAQVAVSTALNAWELEINPIALGPLIGGEALSISHQTWGLRRYEVIGIEGNRVTLNMPLREAVVAGTEIDFNRPGCVMKCVNVESALSAIRMGRFADLSIQFEETWDY